MVAVRSWPLPAPPSYGGATSRKDPEVRHIERPRKWTVQSASGCDAAPSGSRHRFVRMRPARQENARQQATPAFYVIAAAVITFAILTRIPERGVSPLTQGGNLPRRCHRGRRPTQLCGERWKRLRRRADERARRPQAKGRDWRGPDGISTRRMASKRRVGTASCAKCPPVSCAAGWHARTR
jgi:hypothetical protein